MKKSIVLILAVISLTACQGNLGKQEVTIEDRYSITIPSFLTKAYELHDEASLQYQNLSKEFYIIVIDEPKNEMHDVLTKNDLTDIFETNIEGYTKLLLEDYDESIINAQQAEIVDTLINGLPARLTTIKGTIDGLDCFLSLAFLEGEDTYYQVLAWTLADMKDRHGEHMRKMMYTFRELN